MDKGGVEAGTAGEEGHRRLRERGPEETDVAGEGGMCVCEIGADICIGSLGRSSSEGVIPNGVCNERPRTCGSDSGNSEVDCGVEMMWDCG
jgi:hypothetical protein